ncbi:MAG: Hsp70 family protein [Alphaproteobacteria bacterium]|nr:MAG: Hsp70 family protein [Alphaproteobacteria bacterium]
MQIVNPFRKKVKIEAIPLGIDLGTTHTLAAYYDPQKGVQFIKWDDGGILLPSVVSHEGVIFSSTKRYMTDATKVIKDGKTALDIASDILLHVKKRAQQQLNKEIAHAVITVPAYFDDAARQATKIVAEKAGLNVRRIINEPTAAALAYNIDKEGVYAVYDFGGGTFDLSVLRMSQGVFQVLATIGDLQLGGDDIDQAIADALSIDIAEAKKMKEGIGRHHEAYEVGCGDPQQMATAPSGLHHDGLMNITKPLIDKTLKLSQKALSDARVTKLDGVILVGGSTRLKGLRKILEDFFKAPIYADKNPDLIVAEGAALQSYALLHGSEHVLIDVNPLSIGLEVMGGLVEKIISRNTPLPVSKEQTFTTGADGQTAIEFHIVQGEREMACNNRSLAKFVLKDITPMLKGRAKVRVKFSIDTDGLLTVEAADTITNKKISVEVKPTFGLSNKDINAFVLDAQTHAKDDIEKQTWIAKSIEAHNILEAAKAYKCDAYDDIAALQNALDTNDLQALKICLEKVIEILKPLIEQKVAQDLKNVLLEQEF